MVERVGPQNRASDVSWHCGGSSYGYYSLVYSPTSPTEQAFTAVYARILLVTMTHNHTQLAAALHSSNALISDAHRRKIIPSEWLQRLMSVYRVSPRWILHGIEPRDIAPACPLGVAAVAQCAREAEAEGATIPTT